MTTPDLTAQSRQAAHRDEAEIAVLDLTSDAVVRVVVVAAHPDDEILGAGGLLAQSTAMGLDVHVLLLSGHAASHPGLVTRGPETTGRRGPEETTAALGLLAPLARLTSLGLPDGRIDEHQDEIVEAVVSAVGESGRTAVVCAPWRRDGQADHQAAGLASAVAAARTEARLLEYPIWWWHGATPTAMPRTRLSCLPLDTGLADRRWQAIRASRPGVGLVPSSGGDALHRPAEQDGVPGDTDVFIEDEPVDDEAFDQLHTERADPWDVERSWYEERKREITAAHLPRQQFRRGLEIGCSTGALAARLATRCDELLAVDGSSVAVEAARSRLHHMDWVHVEQRRIPQDWPQGEWDLVVVSEVAYFLGPAALRAVVASIETSLAADGVVLLCHWWHEIRGWPLDGPRVHQLWRAEAQIPHLLELREPDFGIDVFGHTSEHRFGEALPAEAARPGLPAGRTG